jgi:phosphate uptake regulator
VIFLLVEVRKIQKTPDGTFLISLPKSWARGFDLKKGSPIYVRERGDGCLVLDPQYAIETTPEITLKLSSRIEDNILSSYLLGYEVIVIEAPRITPMDRKKIKHSINRLVGVEIVEEDSQRIVLQCLLKATAFSPDKILRREYVLSSSMYRDALKALASGDLTLVESIEQRDDEVDRLYFLLVRLLRSMIINPRLSEKLGVSLIDCLDYRLIASLIEGIADQTAEMAKIITQLHKQKVPQKVVESICDVGEKILEAYDETMMATFSKEEKMLNLAVQKRDEISPIIGNLENNFTKLPSEISSPLFIFASILRRIFDCQKDIIDLITPRVTANVSW